MGSARAKVRRRADLGMEGRWPPAPPPVVPHDELPERPLSSRIKVLHVLTKLWGGAAGNTLFSASGMDPDRYEVWIVASPGGHLWEQAEKAGIRTVRIDHLSEVISPLEDLKALIQLVRLMRRERFAVVHTHMTKGGILGRLAARLAGVPVVVHTFHGFSFHEFMSPRRRTTYVRLERFVSRMAHRYVAVAPQVAREAVEMRLARPGTVRVIPSAIPLDEMPRASDGSIRSELGIPPGVPIVGTVGRIVPQKAPLDFVRMAALVARSGRDVRFVMVGDGSFEHDGLEAEARDEAHRLDVDIIFTGFRDDATRFTASFDVFVISSLYEGLGRSLTEALALGRPVVATAVNGVPDLVEHGSTGLLAAPGDPASQARAVEWLLDHPEEAQRMGEQGQARVLGTFDVSAMGAVLDRMYCELLGLPERIAVHSVSRVASPADLRRSSVVDGIAVERA